MDSQIIIKRDILLAPISIIVYIVFSIFGYIDIYSLGRPASTHADLITWIYFNLYIIIFIYLNLFVYLKLVSIILPNNINILLDLKNALLKLEFLIKSFYNSWFGRIILIIYIILFITINWGLLPRNTDFWIKIVFLVSQFIGIIAMLLFILSYLELAGSRLWKLLQNLAATFSCMLLSYLIEESSLHHETKLLLIITIGLFLQLFLIHEVVISILKLIALKLKISWATSKITLVFTSFLDYIILPEIINSDEIHDVVLDQYTITGVQIKIVLIIFAVIVSFVLSDIIFKKYYERLCKKSELINKNRTAILVIILLILNFGSQYINNNDINKLLYTNNESKGMHLNQGNSNLQEKGPDIDNMSMRNEIKDNPPTVQVFQISPRNITYGNAFTLTYTVVDRDQSGLNRVELWRKTEGGNWRIINKTILNSVIGLTYGTFIDIPPKPEDYWYSIHVFDNANNSNDEQNSKTNNHPGIFGPAEATVHYKRVERYVIDLDPPKIISFKVEPIKSNDGKPLLITYTVSDEGGSGLSQVELRQKGEGRDWHTIDGQTIPGNTRPISDSFEDKYTPHTPGSYWYSIRVFDKANQWNDERNSNTNNQPGIFGPIKVTVGRIPGYLYSTEDPEPSVPITFESALDNRNSNYPVEDNSVSSIEPNEEIEIAPINTNPDQDLRDISSEKRSTINRPDEENKQITQRIDGTDTGVSTKDSMPTNGQILNNESNIKNPVIEIPASSLDSSITGGIINVMGGKFNLKLLNTNKEEIDSLKINNNENSPEFHLTVQDENSTGSNHVDDWQEISGTIINGQDQIKFDDYPRISGNYTYKLHHD